MIKVKALEWDDTVHEFGDAGCRNSRADGLLFGQFYAIYTTPAEGVTISAQYGSRQLAEIYASVEEAKAAAQADYEARIRSAILPDVSGMAEPVAWPNGCDKTVPAALRFLAEQSRPSGGEQLYNSAHLYQLAAEIEKVASAPPASDLREVIEIIRDAHTKLLTNHARSTVAHILLAAMIKLQTEGK